MRALQVATCPRSFSSTVKASQPSLPILAPETLALDMKQSEPGPLPILSLGGLSNGFHPLDNPALAVARRTRVAEHALRRNRPNLNIQDDDLLYPPTAPVAL